MKKKLPSAKAPFPRFRTDTDAAPRLNQLSFRGAGKVEGLSARDIDGSNFGRPSGAIGREFHGWAPLDFR